MFIVVVVGGDTLSNDVFLVSEHSVTVFGVFSSLGLFQFFQFQIKGDDFSFDFFPLRSEFFELAVGFIEFGLFVQKDVEENNDLHLKFSLLGDVIGDGEDLTVDFISQSGERSDFNDLLGEIGGNEFSGFVVVEVG